MITEQKIRKYVRRILLSEEVEVTVRPGRGGYKKEIQQAGALAKENPAELMNRLKISKTSEDSDIKRLNAIMSQAVQGTEAMSGVYGEPSPRRDNTTGLEGVRIPVTVIPARDARKYLEHTIVGAQGSGWARFDREIQVEILGTDVLIYFADRPYSWGRNVATRKKKQQQEPQTQEKSQQVEFDPKEKELIGEPDFIPGRNGDTDEASMSSAVSGPATPLGTGPTYPDKNRRRPKSPASVAGRAFGNAVPFKKKK